MKKILLLLPIIGICSSLFAQAPKVENVQAQQSEGTKDVQINFECSAKVEAPYLNLEVWFRESLGQTQWERAMSLSKADGTTMMFNSDWDDVNQEDVVYSHRLEGLSDTLQFQSLIWDAGADAPDVSTGEAQIRVIAFYDKTDEFGSVSPSAQVSGWDGLDDGNGTAGYDDNGTAGYDDNGTSPSGEVYVRDYADANNYYYNSPTVEYPTLVERIASYGISPIAPTGYYDEGSGMSLDVYELSDGIVFEITSIMPPSGILLCAIVGENLIPVILQ